MELLNTIKRMMKKLLEFARSMMLSQHLEIKDALYLLFCQWNRTRI